MSNLKNLKDIIKNSYTSSEKPVDLKSTHAWVSVEELAEDIMSRISLDRKVIQNILNLNDPEGTDLQNHLFARSIAEDEDVIKIGRL
jgi:hypothetical protein